MKIRTDFVTNSSSSCFCVSLCLTLDNGKKVHYDGQTSEGDGEFYACENNDCGNAICYFHKLGETFSQIAESRNNIEELMRVLRNGLGIQSLADLKGASGIKKADMTINACVRGEYSYVAEASNMLGTDNLYGDKDNILSILHNQGLTTFTEDALDEIAESSDKSGSKTYELTMDENGKVNVDFSEGEAYSPKQFDEDEIGEISSGNYMIEFDGAFDDIKESVINWANKKGYDLSLSPDDDEETFFSALGFDGVYVDEDEGYISLEGDLDDCSSLGYPLLELLNIFAEYTSGNLGTFFTDNGPVRIEAEDGELSIELDDDF